MNSYGRIFRVSIFGESHGKGAGICIDGCPPGIPLCEDDLEADLSRRRAGREGTTPRKEADIPHIFSGTFQGHTTGAPIMIYFENTNTRSKDYSLFQKMPRPGHADFVAKHKYQGYTDPRGSGHFSGRITLGLVAAGVIAKKIINPVELESRLLAIEGKTDLQQAIKDILDTGDSAGGLIEIKARNMPIGWGEPFFDSLESQLAHIIFAVPAVKGLEFGSGFKAAKMRGSSHNDSYIDDKGRTETNHAGGINGGISNGNELIMRAAVKPASSISVDQKTFNFESGKKDILHVEGRHDALICLRIPVVLEAAAAIALADARLLAKSWGI